MKPLKNSESTTRKSTKRSGAKKPVSDLKQRHGSRSQKSSQSDPPGPVMGLDLSMTGTGLVVLRGHKVLRKRRYVTAPVAPSEGLKARPRGQQAHDRFIGDEDERIAWIKKKVLASAKKYEVCFVVIEGHAFQAKGRGKTVLSELAGVIKNALYERDIAFVVKTPQQIKKHVTGDGRADKIDVIYAAKHAGVDISDSDRADAWAAARLGWDCFDELVEE